MSLQFQLYFVALILSAVISVAVGILAWLRRPAPGAIPLAVIMLGLTIWSGSYAVMWLNAAEAGQVFWLKVTYFGILLVPISYFAFVLHVTQNDHWLTPARLALLAVEPLATLVIVWTNDFHELYHVSLSLEYRIGVATLQWERGPWFWLNLVYSYVLLLAGTLLLARALVRSAPLFRAQIGVLLLGASLPWAANIYSQFEFGSFQDFDLTPIAFSLTGLLFAYALFRQRMFDLLPVARSLIIEGMSDGVIVVDQQLRFLDMNPAAKKMMQIGDESLGQPGSDIFPEWGDLAAIIQGRRTEFHAEVQGRRDPTCRIDLSVSPLFDRRDNLSGHLIVFRDITERWQSEQSLRLTNKELKDRLKEINVLQRKLRVQAIRDPLTNLYNRRHLVEVLEREVVRAGRAASRVSVILMDVDGFKKINDTYGHKTGDAALQHLADLFHTHIRSSDIACRYGGEEFVIVMPGTPPEVARRRAEHIRQEYQQHHLDGRAAAGETTLSIGIASYPEHGSRAEEVLHAADEAMYNAKTLGGNRTIIYKRSSGGSKKKAAEKKGAANPSSKTGRRSRSRPKAAR